tara:strand:+ start:41 stop:1648 length:1608 start_codon:yes stop_codon:yes gene_type:complete
MSDLRKLLKEEYRKKKTTVNPQSLMEMIEEMMELFEGGKTDRGPAPAQQRRERTVRFPVLVPTEQSVGQYTASASEDRATFEYWMKQIAPGGDLATKIKAIDNFIKQPPPDASVAATLSYLMFIQTFSYMIREFNASVAGFLWEPFLAALFGESSRQVHTEEGDISDVIILNAEGDTKNLSLKILAPAGGVGGSFVDLVNHFAANPNDPMVYVVIRKQSAKGGKDNKEIKDAKMEFFQYPISQENFFEWIGHPKVAIQRDTIEFTVPPGHVEKHGPGRAELAATINNSSEGKIMPKGWIVDGHEISLGDKRISTTGVVDGETYAIAIRSIGKEAGKAGPGAQLTPNAKKLWGDEKTYSQWYELWQKMKGDPEFWQLVRGPEIKRHEAHGDPGTLPGPPFAPKGAAGYVGSEQFKVSPGYEQKILKKPMGTINILPEVLMSTFQQGADIIGDDLSAMFNALSALVDNVGRFFLIDCGDPQAEAKKCDEKDAQNRSAAGKAAIDDANTLKRVVDERIATEFEEQKGEQMGLPFGSLP